MTLAWTNDPTLKSLGQQYERETGEDFYAFAMEAIKEKMRQKEQFAAKNAGSEKLAKLEAVAARFAAMPALEAQAADALMKSLWE